MSTDDEVLDWVRRDAETALHPSCTARMGIDDDSVVDPLTMGVHGLDGLRVVDASAMPYVTNGNIYAPVMMLAEKAADLILGETPLPAEPTPFYRHARPERRGPYATGTGPGSGEPPASGGLSSSGGPVAPSSASACCRSLIAPMTRRQMAATMPRIGTARNIPMMPAS